MRARETGKPDAAVQVVAKRARRGSRRSTVPGPPVRGCAPAAGLATVAPTRSTGERWPADVAYPFLSDEWEAEARRIRAEYEGRSPSLPLSIRMNLIVTEVPFGTGMLHAHLDTSSAGFELELGHLERPDVTLTLDYVIARGVLVDGDPQAVLAAFLGGRIKVDGDITKLLELQTSGVMAGAVDPLAVEVYQRIRAITE